MPSELDSLLSVHKLSAHRDRLEEALLDTKALHLALKDLGVAPIGKRLELAGALRSAADAAQCSAADTASRRVVLKDEGNAHAVKGDLRKAIASYESALALGDDDDSDGASTLTAALFSNLSTVLRKAERAEEAVCAAQAAISARPLWCKGHFRRGEASFAVYF